MRAWSWVGRIPFRRRIGFDVTVVGAAVCEGVPVPYTLSSPMSASLLPDAVLDTTYGREWKRCTTVSSTDSHSSVPSNAPRASLYTHDHITRYRHVHKDDDVVNLRQESMMGVGGYAG